MEIFIGIVVILLVILFFFSIAEEFAKHDRKVAERIRQAEVEINLKADQEARYDEIYHSTVREVKLRYELITADHIANRDVLQRKYRQLVYKDDYGNVCEDRWQIEYNYYLRKLWEKNSAFWCESPDDIFSYDEFLECCTDLNDIDPLVPLKSDELDAEITYDPKMTGVEFEKLVAAILESNGWDVTLTPASGDQGVDLIASFDTTRVAVQCKRSSKPIGNKAVQEALAGMHFAEASEAWVVSDNSFTTSARQLASSTGISLYHFEEIADL
jgi:restriction system protein